MGVAAILVMWPGPFQQTFIPPSLGVSIWNLSLIGQLFSEEKMFENVDGRTPDGRRSDWYTISSPMSLRLRWAKKLYIQGPHLEADMGDSFPFLNPDFALWACKSKVNVTF